LAEGQLEFFIAIDCKDYTERRPENREMHVFF